MKLKHLLISAFLILAGITQSWADTEPDNNAYTGADAIALNDSATGACGGVGDNDDWYIVSTDGDGDITISIDNDGPYTYLYLYDNDGTTSLGYVSGYGTISKTYTGLAEGTYYIKVHNQDGLSNYTLHNSLAVDSYDQDSEPNDDYTNAKNLPENGTKEGHIDYRQNGGAYDNDDWYKVTTSEDGNLAVTFNALPNHYIYLYIYDNDGTFQLASAAGYPGGSGVTVTRTGLSAGTYYVKVHAHDGYMGYSLGSALTPDPRANDSEPNDSSAFASVLPLNDSVQGHIDYFKNGNTHDNDDWYKVTTTSDGDLSINLTGSPNDYVYLYLYDIDATTQLGSAAGFSGGGVTLTRTGLSAGTYYFKVRGIDGYIGYTLSNTSTPDPRANDTEPNDSSAIASVLPLNDSVQGHIDYFRNGNTYDNDDWYQLVTLEDGNINLTLTNTNSHYVYLYLYDNNATTLLKSVSGYPGATGISLSGTGLAPGTYYIKVHGHDGYSGYTLFNSLAPGLYANDIEPNNDFTSASNLQTIDTVTGHIDYRYNGGTYDVDDYWVMSNCLPGDITVTLNHEVGHYFYFYLYNASFTQLGSASGFGSLSITKTGQPAGVYYVKVHGSDGYDTYQLISSLASATAPLVINSSTVTNTTCGLDNGGVDITITGGTPAYTYSWSNSATTEDVNGLASGNYTVVVNDQNGCSATKNFVVGASTAVTASATGTDPLCSNSNDGSIDLTVNSGGGSYTYAWSNGATTEDVNGLSSGSYSVTVTDQYSCTATASAIVTAPAAISISSSVTDVSCNGNSNGAIDITASGGTVPYTYSWSNGSTDEDQSGLSGGGYTVTVTDAHGCTGSSIISVTEPTLLSLSVTSANVHCSGNSDGSIDLTVGGGTPGYTYSWSNGSTDEDQSGLSGGDYTVTVTDAHGCTGSTTVTITEPAALSASVTSADPQCASSNDGSIDLTTSGGTPAYTYSWSNGATTEDVSGLGGGSYSVTVTDQNGCTAMTSATLTEPSAITIGSSTTNAQCGNNNGTIDITVAGGTPGYSYSWSNGSTDEDQSGLAAGDYTVTVTDAHGCEQSQTITVGNTSGLSATVTTTDPLCAGSSDGSIDLTASGGSGGYTYLWSNGSTNEDQSGLPAGSYSVTVTDMGGCSTSAAATLNEPAAVVIGSSVTDAACNGNSDGAIDITATGGTPGYAYSWSNGSMDEDQSGLMAGNYTVTVTDAHGCTGSASIDVSEPAVLSAGETHADESSPGANDGSIDVTISGGTSPYSYLWNDGATTEDRSGIGAGTYDVTVTDAHGCTTALSVTIQSSGGCVCVVPDNLLITDLHSSSAILTWDGNACATGYEVRRKKASNNSWGNYISELGAGVTTKKFKNLNPGITYEAQVRSVCEDGATYSDWSPSIFFTTYDSCRTADTLYTDNVMAHSVDFHWSYSLQPDKWIIHLTHVNSGSKVKIFMNGTVTTRHLDNLLASSDYTWKIQAKCGDEKSAFSPVLSFSTPAQRTGEVLSSISGQLSVYPNPAADLVHVQFVNGVEGQTILRVMDMNGRVMQAQQSDMPAGYADVELNIHGLSAGMYQLQIIAADGVVMNQPLVVQK